MEYKQKLYGKKNDIYILYINIYFYINNNYLIFYMYFKIKLQKKEGNNICIDCGAPNPQWYFFFFLIIIVF